MTFWELLIIAAGVSMDAFAVSVCKGLSARRIRSADPLAVGLWFGGFQALMPLIGYFLGISFADMVSDVDHWIAFVLLLIIGGNMIKGSFENESCDVCADFSVKSMFPLAIATSIDALAIGISFAFLRVDIWSAITIIGLTTAFFSAGGLYVGCFFGSRFKSKAEFMGGLVLCCIGLKILVEHLMA